MKPNWNAIIKVSTSCMTLKLLQYPYAYLFFHCWLSKSLTLQQFVTGICSLIVIRLVSPSFKGTINDPAFK